MDTLEIIDTQNHIIKCQSDVINDLFKLLANYMTLEEMDKLPEVSKINHIAALKKNI